MNSEKPHVAIIGGGVAGVALALSLLHRDVPCKIYESEDSLLHHHGNLTIPPQAIHALLLCAPGVIAAHAEADSKRDIFLQAPSTYQMPLDALKDETKVLVRFKHPGGISSCLRKTFLQAMLDVLPEGTLEYGKKMMHVNVLAEGKLILEFDDHSSAAADVVIGCDGAFSRTRSLVVGKVHPSARAQYSGQVAYDVLVPMDSAAAALGQQRAMSTCIHMNYGSCIHSTPVAEGKLLNLNIVISEQASWNDERTSLPVDKTEVLEKTSRWPAYMRNLIEKATGPIMKWALFELLDWPPPHFVQGRIAIIADAVHVSAPQMAINAGAAIEDVLILAELLADKRVGADKAKLELALAAYEAVRLRRGYWSAHASRRVAELVMFRAKGIEDDLEKLEKEYESLFRDAHAWNAEVAIEEAKQELGNLLAM